MRSQMWAIVSTHSTRGDERLAKQIRRPERPTRAFDVLKTVKVNDLTPGDLDGLIDKVFLQDGNSRLLDDIRRIGMEKQSPGGPKCGGSQISRYSFTDTGSADIFQPDTGTVWMLQQFMIEFSSSSTYTYSITLEVDGISMPIVGTTSKSGNGLLNVGDIHDFPDSNFFLDSNCKIQVETGGSFSSITTSLMMTRWR